LRDAEQVVQDEIEMAAIDQRAVAHGVSVGIAGLWRRNRFADKRMVCHPLLRRRTLNRRKRRC
jgi:hypothetical protein